MKIVYFKKNGQPVLGIHTVNSILDVDAYQQFNGRKTFSSHHLKKSEIAELKNIVEDAIVDDRFFWKNHLYISAAVRQHLLK